MTDQTYDERRHALATQASPASTILSSAGLLAFALILLQIIL